MPVEETLRERIGITIMTPDVVWKKAPLVSPAALAVVLSANTERFITCKGLVGAVVPIPTFVPVLNILLFATQVVPSWRRVCLLCL